LLKAKALIVSCLVATALIAPPVVQKVLAWTTQEHMVTNFTLPANISQSNADNTCRNSVYNHIDWNGGNFYDGAHGGIIGFVKFARPYVWGNVQQRRCVINASWGYFTYG
jgi:hypothetical protein